MKYGKWTVIGEDPNRKYHKICECQCGKRKSIYFYNLKHGKSKQCLNCSNVRHGHARKKNRSGLYRLWERVLNRCSPDYKKADCYCDRGITVCDKWKTYDNFMKDIGPIYEEYSKNGDKLTFDRIDNNRGYEPGNVRFATYEQQSRNRRGNVYIEFNGEKMVIMDWAKRLNISHESMRMRLKKWPLERALTEPRNEKCYRNGKKRKAG